MCVARVMYCLLWCSPHYFKTVQISALALLKMVMHARSGGRLEVMGLMLGKIDGPSMVVMDAFALPVEGTETRVNAQAAAYEYMSTYIEAAKKASPATLYLALELCRRSWLLVEAFSPPPCLVVPCIHVCTGWSSGECSWLVPQPSWIRLLVVRD